MEVHHAGGHGLLERTPIGSAQPQSPNAALKNRPTTPSWTRSTAPPPPRRSRASYILGALAREVAQFSRPILLNSH